jgi:multiple sugar transport system permease protein
MRKNLEKISCYLLLSVYAAFVLFPVYWTVTMSFKSREHVFVRVPEWFPRQFTVSNYISIMERSDNVGRFFLNSIIVSLSTVLFVLIISSMAGYGLTRYHFRGKKLVTYSIFAVRIVPSLVYMIPFYLIFFRLRMTDNLLSLILCYVAVSLPLSVWLFIGFFEEIPPSIYESGIIDGCNDYFLFIKIAFPLVLSGVVVVVLLTFMGAWNEFGIALVLTNKDAFRTLPLGINTMVLTMQERPYGPISAAGVIAMLPALAIAVTMQRYMIKGLTAGALKG